MKKSGIYKIINTKNSKIYIGSSVDLFYRIKRHQNDLKRNSHCNDHLQKSWNKYGAKYFNVYRAKCVQVRGKNKPSIYEKDTFIGRFLKRSDCEKTINVKEKFIRRCLQGTRSQSHGYIFEYEEAT